MKSSLICAGLLLKAGSLTNANNMLDPNMDFCLVK